MFYNMPARRRAFKPGPEEHNLLQDVLQRYAVYKAGAVGFTLKRQVCSSQAASVSGYFRGESRVQDCVVKCS